MSNTYTNSVEFDVVPCTDAPETPLEAMEAPEVVDAPETMEVLEAETPAPKKKKKKGACRFFSLLLLALCAVAFVLPMQVIKGLTPENATLLASITDLFAGGQTSSIFGMLPVYTDAANIIGMFVGVVFYALVIALAFTALLALLALISGNVRLFRVAVYFFVTGFGAYAACGYLVPTFHATDIGPDRMALALTGIGAFLYVVLGFAKKGGKAFASIFQLLFTLVFTAATAMAFNGFSAEITTVVGSFGLTFALMVMIVFSIVWVNALFGAARVLAKKGLGFDMVRYVIQLLISAVLFYVAYTQGAGENNMLWKFVVAAMAASLLQILICSVQLNLSKKAVEEEEEIEEEQPVVVPEPEFTVEEYAEALPYDGGPVEGVEIAQEVNPTFEENPIEPIKVNTAGYDFYNSKSFDPFIAILNNEERNQFTELFILKYKGLMPEIPDYEVGGNNKEFFRKLFIYLGQYRDRIPDGLLAKIYQFAIRNS